MNQQLTFLSYLKKKCISNVLKRYEGKQLEEMAQIKMKELKNRKRFAKFAAENLGFEMYYYGEEQSDNEMVIMQVEEYEEIQKQAIRAILTQFNHHLFQQEYSILKSQIFVVEQAIAIETNKIAQINMAMSAAEAQQNISQTILTHHVQIIKKRQKEQQILMANTLTLASQAVKKDAKMSIYSTINLEVEPPAKQILKPLQLQQMGNQEIHRYEITSRIKSHRKYYSNNQPKSMNGSKISNYQDDKPDKQRDDKWKKQEISGKVLAHHQEDRSIKNRTTKLGEAKLKRELVSNQQRTKPSGHVDQKHKQFFLQNLLKQIQFTKRLYDQIKLKHNKFQTTQKQTKNRLKWLITLFWKQAQKEESIEAMKQSLMLKQLPIP